MVYVLGSLNIDLVSTMERMPLIGETVIGQSFDIFIGGKGLNQAVSCARAGAKITMLGAIGSDDYGTQLLVALNSEKIESKYIVKKEGTSGVAIIDVDNSGQNRIIVVPGANGLLSLQDIPSDIFSEKKINVVLAQLEIPIQLVQKVFELSKSAGIQTILNPAPAQPLPKELLAATDMIIPNQFEAETLTGVRVSDQPTAERAGRILIEQGVREVIITLGDSGSLYISESEVIFQPAFKVSTIDTTAAGDSYCGALVAMLSDRKTRVEAMRFASAAGALTTTKRGAIASIPEYQEILSLLC